jgi:protoheme IX farnesyltransferase
VQRLARWIPVAAVAATLAQIVLGGVVRVSGSGLGCPGWPLCPGLVPPGELHAIIEYAHRAVGSVASTLIVLSALLAWHTYRRRRGAVLALGGAAVLLLVEVALGAVTVLLKLPPLVVLAHLSIAFIILALLITGSVLVQRAPDAGGPRPSAPLWFLAAGTFVLALSGAFVVGSGSSLACAGWPLCGAGVTLPSAPGASVQMLHRLLAAAVGLLILVAMRSAWRAYGHRRGVRVAMALTVASYLAQVLVGALTVLQRLPPLLRGLHLAFATALWASVVLLLVLARGQPAPSAPPLGRRGRAWGTVADYLSLTKPRIIGLLLLTALGALLLPGHGWPAPHLVVFTLLGGALAAASANSINCWFDRDIDHEMRRTQERPLPAGRIAPNDALAFGLMLGVLAVGMLLAFVNALAAALAGGAILFYVLVYTVWLKRSTPQNIVIGGAAGAVPPLVAWAAVTQSLDLTALYLFAIIFFWTPPHFWALALLARTDYARAGVPMLPVVSEVATRRLIVLYSLVLVVVTLLLFVTRALGTLYLLAALALGGTFLVLAVQTWRDHGLRWARRLFTFSIAYLAVLFAAMVADRLLV